jgi:hypothetical protein
MSLRKKWEKRLTETWQKKEKRGLEKRRTISRSINGDICLPFLLVTYLFYTTYILVNMNECKVKQNCSTVRIEYLHNWSGSKMLLSVHWECISWRTSFSK